MSDTYQKLKVFSLSANRPLAREIALNMGIELGEISVKTFSDGEVQINIEESVRGCDVFVIQSTNYPVHKNIMELLIMIDALMRASANSINVVIPYFAYGRQDRKARPREPITAKLFADLIQRAGATRVVSLDLHAPQIQGFFDIPVDSLNGIPILSNYFKSKDLKDTIVVAPDTSGVKEARQMAEILKAPIAIIDRRGPRTNQHEILNIVGEIEGKTAILLDDIVDTGVRITSGTKILLEHGAKEVYASATHPVLSEGAVDRIIESPVKEIVVTNSIDLHEEKMMDKLTQLTVAPLLSEAIIRIHNQESVSKLFE